MITILGYSDRAIQIARPTASCRSAQPRSPVQNLRVPAGESSWKSLEQRRLIELIASGQHVSLQPYMMWSPELYVPGHATHTAHPDMRHPGIRHPGVGHHGIRRRSQSRQRRRRRRGRRRRRRRRRRLRVRASSARPVARHGGAYGIKWAGGNPRWAGGRPLWAGGRPLIIGTALADGGQRHLCAFGIIRAGGSPRVVE
jgi:hypothetical protein